MNGAKTKDQLELQIKELVQHLDEANDTIEAIRSGQIDALIVKNKNGPEIYTLKSADQTYRVFIERMTEGAVTLNKDGVILYSNPRLATMLDLPLTKIIGSYFQEYLEPESKQTFNKLFKKGWKAESKGEINLLAHSDKVIPVLISLNTLMLDEGNALSLIITDLTDQKAIQQELKEKNILLENAKATSEKLNNELELRVKERTHELLLSREHFKFLADNIPVIIWTASSDGHYDYFNHQWYNYTGLNFEQSKKMGWKPVIHPDDLEATMVEWESSLKEGKPFKKENRLRSADGAFRWHLVQALPFKSKEGKILAWFGVDTDIDDQKKDMKKKDEFIGMASHELKTPVTSLKIFTEIMLLDAEGKGNTKEAAMLQKMDKQINKLTILIGDLLDASKANSGKLNYNFEEIDFNNLVVEMIKEAEVTSSRHKLEMKLVDSANVQGDRNRLGQVIANFLSNAIKYSPKAEKVVIFSEKTDKNIILSVQDFGIGISISDQPKVFSRFFRVSENTFPGLGLGLYICKEIIERHAGTIYFESKEGKGSTFSFSLPLKKSA